MDFNAVSSLLEKQGPMGCALIVVCLVLYLFVTKVLPNVMETQGKRLDGIIQGLRDLVHLITGRLDQQEEAQMRRHEEAMQRLGRIETKIDDIPARTPERDHGSTP